MHLQTALLHEVVVSVLRFAPAIVGSPRAEPMNLMNPNEP